MPYNELGDKGAKAIAEALKTNTTLAELDLGKNINIQQRNANFSLSYNRIGHGGANAIGETLQANTVLVDLSLG